MKEQHFIAIADWVISLKGTPDELTRCQTASLAEFLLTQSPVFNDARWLGYIDGTCGPSGGVPVDTSNDTEIFV